MDAQCGGCKSCCKTIDAPAEVKTPIDLRIRTRLGEPELSCLGEPSTVITDCENGCRLLVIQHLNLRVTLHYEACADACRSEITCAEDC